MNISTGLMGVIVEVLASWSRFELDDIVSAFVHDVVHEFLAFAPVVVRFGIWE